MQLPTIYGCLQLAPYGTCTRRHSSMPGAPSRPSGLYIDDNDILYSADSESNFSANAGWKRGIRIGSAKDGMVFAFIPDPEWTGDVRGTTAAEGVAVDADGNIYGAEVGPRALRKHVKR